MLPSWLGNKTFQINLLSYKLTFQINNVLTLVLYEQVLTRLVQDMKHKVNGSLLADYSKFKRERPMNKA